MREEQHEKEEISVERRATNDGHTRGKAMDLIETYIRQEKWEKAQGVLLKELQFAPDSHWLWARLSLICHEQYNYEKALEYAEKALSLAPWCPLVLWRYAGALYQLGLAKEALTVWKGLLKRGVQAVAHGECGEGMASARLLLNDCNYRIGRCYAWIGKPVLAMRYFHKYLENRKKGVRSIYSLRDVKKEFAAVQFQKGKGGIVD